MAADIGDGTSKNHIYKELRRLIIMGHRKPGERLDVVEIAAHYETSVTPVRDALQMLNQEGLVTIKPRSGYYITHITLKQLRDMLEMRKILETASVERAAQRITEKQLEKLRKVHAGYTGDDDLSYDRYTDENRRFHFLIAEATGNHELATTLGRLMDRLARFMVIRHAGQTQNINHMLIIDALQSHDVEAARNLILKELDETRELILDEVLQEEEANWHLDTFKPIDTHSDAPSE